MKRFLVISLCLLIPEALIATESGAGTNCPVVSGFNLSSLSGDWQTVGHDTCEGCTGQNYLNLSICGPLSDTTCGGGDVSVCFLNSLLLSSGGEAVSAGVSTSRQVHYNNETKAVTITYDYYLSQKKGTTTIVLFCGRHLGVPRVTGSSIKSYRMSIEWETDVMCEYSHLVENKCYLVRFDYAYFTPYLYDLTPLVKSKGAYLLSPNGASQRFALNLCQEISPDGSGLVGCEGSVLCELKEGGNQPVVLAEGSQGVQDSGGLISLLYSSPPANQTTCGGDAVLSILFHCPYEFDISPGPRMIVRDADCYFHVDWYTDHACAQRYSKDEGCLIQGTSRNPFKFDLTSLGAQNYSVPAGTSSYEIRICDGAGVLCNGVHTKVCQKESHYEWDLGSGEGTLHYEDGELSLTYYHGRTCETNQLRASSTFNFVCSQSNSTGPQFLGEQDCSYFFEWSTPLACPSISPHTGSCKDVMYQESRYDISHLRRGDQENWVAGIGAFIETSTSSRFLLNLCGPLNTEGSSQTSAPSPCSGYGVCETTDDGVSIGIGKFSEVYARPGNVLVVRYTDGVCKANESERASVSLVIICKVGVTDSSPVFVGAYGCEFEFQWEHSAACPTSSHVTHGEDCRVRDPATLYTYDLSPLESKRFHLSASSYDYDLAVCSQLNASLGEKCSGAGACQTKGSSSYSLGLSNSTLSFSNGTLQMRYSGGDTCSGGVSRSTLVSFACDLNSTGLKEVEDPEKSHCSYFFIMYTDRACPFEYYFTKCTYTDSDEHTYDLSPLIREFDNWNGSVASGTTSALRGAKFYINVCRPVNNVPKCHPLSSACMRIRTDGGYKWVSLGKPMTGLRPVGGNAKYGLRIMYTENEPADIPGLCNATTPQTGITFLCPQTTQTSRLSYPRLIGVDTSGCIFEFEWYTKLACSAIETPVSAPCSVQDPESGFIFSFQSLEGTINVQLENATNTSPSFYLSICSSINAQNIQSSLSSSSNTNTGSLIFFTDSSSGNNASLGEANSDVRFSDGELIQLMYSNGEQCSDGKKKSTLITFVCEHYLTNSVSFIHTSPITADTCLFEFEFRTILACPPVTTECIVSSNGGRNYDLTRLKQLSGTGFSVSLPNSYGDIPANSELKISICQPLEAGSGTSCSNGSASCLSHAGQHLDLGRVTGGLQLSGEGELQLIYSGGSGCSKGAVTVLTFRCDPTAEAGEPFLSLHRNTSGFCYYYVVWSTEYACPLTPTESSSCAVPDPDTGFVYNFTSLRDGPDLSIAPNLTAYDSIYQYGFTFSVCRPVKSSCGANSPPLTAACQSTGDTHYVTGLASSELILEDGEVKLTYSGGKPCSNGANRTTVVRFYCDREASSPHPVILPETTHCLYEILLYTALACPPQLPGYKCAAPSPDSHYVYDLSTLQHRSYYEVFHRTDTLFYFSVCGLLPSQYGDKGVECGETSFCMLQWDSSLQKWAATDLGTMAHAPYLAEDNLIVLFYSTSDASHNTTVFLYCPGEDQAAGGPTVVSQNSDSSLNFFSWKTIAACRSAPSDTCQMVQYGTGFTLDLYGIPVASGVSGVDGSLTISLCGALSDASLGECSDGSTAVCLKKGSAYHRIATNHTSKWFYGDDILISYYDGFSCPDSSSKFASSVEVMMQCGASEKRSLLEVSNECVYRVQWETPSLCQYQVECSVENGGQKYDLNLLKAYDSNWRVKFNDELFLINVCHNLLPEEKQRCPATAAICLLNGTHAVSLGQVAASPQYVSEGKLKIEYVNGDKCGDGTYGATVLFTCEKGADLEEYITLDKGTCHYTFNWATHTACADDTGTVTETCEITDSVTGDVFDLVPLLHLGNVTVSNDPLYQVIACGVFKNCKGASVCYNNNNNFGVYNSKASLKLVNHSPVLQYTSGDECGGGIKYESQIEFVCNKSAVDNNYVEHLRVATGCKHFFLWHTPLACVSAVTECKVSVGSRVVDLTDLNKKYGAWEVTVRSSGSKLYFNPCTSMSYFLETTNLTSQTCSSDSLVCILKGGDLYEVGSLDTAVLRVSADGKYPVETARSQTGCWKNKHKTNSVKILFYPDQTMMGTPYFTSSVDTPTSCESTIIFKTSLVSQSPPINEYGGLTDTLGQGECHDTISKLGHDTDYHVVSNKMGETLHFYINFCAYASKGGCKDASVCLQSSTESSPLPLSSHQKQRVSVVNESYIELIMSSADKGCKLSDKPILTLFYIACSPGQKYVSIELLHISPAGCLYAFSVLAPDSICSLYELTSTTSPAEGLTSSAKTAVVFIIVLVVCFLFILLAILVTLCFYKRSHKGDRVFYKLRTFLSGVPNAQYRFKRVDGSEVGHLISNMSGSESDDDEVESEQRLTQKVDSDKFVVAPPDAKEDGLDSQDEDFIKL